MFVGRICVRSVDTVELADSVLTAAQRMHDRNVGSLVVVDNEQRPLGIITDRDIVVRTVIEQRDPAKATVWGNMTQLPQTVNEDTTTEEVLSIMRSGPYRRLPVVNHEGRLAGIVSLDDVLNVLASEFSEIAQLLRKESPQMLQASSWSSAQVEPSRQCCEQLRTCVASSESTPYERACPSAASRLATAGDDVEKFLC